MILLVRISFVVVLLSCFTACTPITHTVKPLPDFVNVALKPGDIVTVTMHDGTEFKFEIMEIRGDALIGEKRKFVLRDLATIKKHAWSRPESPCGGEKPLGCSVPLPVALASDLHSHYAGKFYDACAQHDYCYRHGRATYGIDRENCDDEFLIDMKNLCPDEAAGKLGKVLEMMDDSVESRQYCLIVANDFYNAVQRYGEKRFETTDSTYCEYNEPPLLPARAVKSGSSESKSQ